MSAMTDPLPAMTPEWDLADRMRKALRHATISPGAMALYLGVGGGTVSTWINGRIEPSAQTLRLWALRTGVSFRWLCHGTEGPHPDTQSIYMQCLQTCTPAA